MSRLAALASLRPPPARSQASVGEAAPSLLPVAIIVGSGVGMALLLNRFASVPRPNRPGRNAWPPPPPSKRIEFPRGEVKTEYLDRLDAWRMQNPEDFKFDDMSSGM